MEYSIEQQIRFDIVSESQLTINYPQDKIKEKKKRLKILSLFSGCGGMDLGFEGGFIAPYKSIIPHPEWIERQVNTFPRRLSNQGYLTVKRSVLRALLSGAYGLAWLAARPVLCRHKRLQEGFPQRLVPDGWPGSAN